MLSDYDVVVIVEEQVDESDLRLWSKKYRVDLHIFQSASISTLLEKTNSILLDAIIKGLILFDGIPLFPRIKKEALEIATRMNLIRTDMGWMSQ